MDASGWIEFETPANFQGQEVRIAWDSGADTYWAVYDLNNRTSGVVEFAGETVEASILSYDRDYVRTPPEDGYASIPYTARLEETPWRPEPLRFRLKQTIQNFTFIFRTSEPGYAMSPSGALLAPFSQAYLMSGAKQPGSLQPSYGGYGWGPNFLDLPVRGEFHHAKLPSARTTLVGEFEIWLGHSVLEVTNGTGSHEYSLRASISEPVGGPEPETIVHYRAEMLHGTFAGRLTVSIGAPELHMISRNPRLDHVTDLATPLAVGTVGVEGSEYHFGDRSHLDFVGNFSLGLRPFATNDATEPNPHRIQATIAGRLAGVVIDRSTSFEFPREASAAAAAGLGLLGAVYLVVSWMRRGTAWLVGQWAIAHLVTWHPLSAKISTDAVLDHPVRRSLFEMIHSGHAFTRLSRFQRDASTALGITSVTVYYHVRKLHAAGVVTLIRRTGGRSLSIAPADGLGGDPAERAAKIFLRDPRGLAVATAVLEGEGRTQREVCNKVREGLAGAGAASPRTAWSDVAIHKWLKRLESFAVDSVPVRAVLNRGPDTDFPRPCTPRLVTTQREGRYLRYWPTELLRRVAALEIPPRPSKQVDER